MSRRRAAVSHERQGRSREEGPSGELVPDADPGGGRLAGYRLIRQVATGERADLFLAAAEVPVEAADTGPHRLGEAESDPPAGPPLVILRVSRADASDDAVALEIEAMSTDATGTLPALYDVAGLDDGRCVLAVERIGGGALSRLLAARTLTPGESVTVLAPIVVAVADLAGRGYVHTRLAVSDVLIDDSGRPRLVGLGALRRLPARSHADRTILLREAHSALADLISEVATAVRPAGVLDGVIEVIHERLAARPFRPCEAEVERRLFEIALPEPIGGVDARPRASGRLPARAVAPSPLPGHDEGEPMEASPRRVAGEFSRTLLGLAQMPAELVRLRSADDLEPAGGIGDRLRELVARRRRSLTVGGLVGGGALVLLLTLVPPATAGDAPEAATADAAPGVDSGDVDPSDPPAPNPDASAPPEGGALDTAPPIEPVSLDPVAAAGALLERRAECFRTLDLACLDDVVQPGSAAETEDRAALVAARDGAAPPEIEFDHSAITVTTEMGGAVLVSAPRSATGREPASLLMVRGEAGWRLREFFG